MFTIALALVALSTSATTLDDLVAYTVDGREVVLRANGTWEYAERQSETDANSVITTENFHNVKVSVVSYNEIPANQRENFDGYTVMHEDDVTVINILFENTSSSEIINIKGTNFGYNEATGEGFYFNRDFEIIDEFDNRFGLVTDGLRPVIPSSQREEEPSTLNITPGSALAAPSRDGRRQARRFRREGQSLRPGESVELRFVFNGRPIEAASRVTLIFPSYTLGPSRERLVIPR